jgi:copper chaperone
MPKIMVKGMRCKHCVDSVTKALTAIDGIEDVAVSLEKGDIVYTESKPVDLAKVKEVINKAGFEAL